MTAITTIAPRAVDAVNDSAGVERDGEERDRTKQAVDAQQQRRASQLVDEPALGNLLHPADETQPKLWAEMKALHGSGLDGLLIDALVKELALKGALHVLRHGFKFYGKTFRIAFFKPAHGLNYEVLALYEKNRLTVTRQVLCHPGKHDTVDLLFAVNGLPVATCDMKNPGTGQSWKHAVTQYQQDRDPRAPLFDFKRRALVHFAADPDEVHMTTRLQHAATDFLPFNRGEPSGRGPMWRWQPAASFRPSDGVFLGRCARARQFP